MTYNDILQSMLDKVPNTYDKRVGSFFFLVFAPIAYILSLFHKLIDNVFDETNADTAVGIKLTRKCAERGVNRKSATSTIRKAEFNKQITLGDRFGIDGVTFICTELLVNNSAKLKCEVLGEIGNTVNGTLLPLSYIEGLTTAMLTDILIPGSDEEDDETLRSRYYDSLESEAFGGNRADYKNKMLNLQGVGGVKVTRAANGGGTVKLTFIDSTFSKPSQTLVSEVQTSIDPTINSGDGLGLAPLCHVVTVEAVTESLVNIVSSITLVTGYIWQDVSPYVSAAVEDYLLELRKVWQNESSIVVRISQIESAILKVTGVLDITGTTINTKNTNLILTAMQIPKLGSVSTV
ncbi:MAG TPA: phage tail protein [Clostridiales bacterium]|nr:phage tail protein [Clostridiales bacterium]